MAMSFLFIELEGGGIDAVAQLRRRWTVVEQMAEVGATPAAHHFYPAHKEAMILFGFDILPRGRRPETGPTGAGIELRLRVK